MPAAKEPMATMADKQQRRAHPVDAHAQAEAARTDLNKTWARVSEYAVGGGSDDFTAISTHTGTLRADKRPRPRLPG